MKNYSLKLYQFQDPTIPYGTIEVPTPSPETITSDITGGEHYRTTFEDGRLTLEFEDRLITLIVDESGSMSWNDLDDDRITMYKRLLTKLTYSYSGDITVNVVGFGGVLTDTKLIAAPANEDSVTELLSNVDAIQKLSLQDGVYDFAGVRIVRRTDRFPENPLDGTLVAEGFIDTVQDDDLNPGQTYYYGVWTFNKNKHYSNGEFISIKTADKEIPRGVLYAEAIPRILPGILKDSNSLAIYNFSEGSGSVTYDSSGNHKHGIISSSTTLDNMWLGDSASRTNNYDNSPKKPLGVKFDGSLDYIKADDPNEDFAVGSGGDFIQSISVNFWVYPYEQDKDGWIAGTWNPGHLLEQIGWCVVRTTDGRITASWHPIPPTTVITNPVSNKEWTMITLVFNGPGAELRTYVNGELDQTIAAGAIDTRGFNELHLGGIPVDSASSFAGDSLFGVLHLFSLNRNLFSADYIKNLYNHTSPIFNQDSQQSSDNPPDNTQREILLGWEIDDDFDYAGGTVRVVRKYNSAPAHKDDGTVVIEQAASVGDFYYLDSYDFVCDSDYYYRFFTINQQGSPCDRSEARLISAHPQAWYRQENDYLQNIINNSPWSASSATTVPGNRKVEVEWSFPHGRESSLGTRVYYSSKNYPTIDENFKISDGILLTDISRDSQITNFTGTDYTAQQKYIHRSFNDQDTGEQLFLTNGEYHFYTLVTYDRLGRLSEPAYALGIPSSQETSVFRPNDVKDLYIDLINTNALLLKWENETTRSEELELWMGESALIFTTVRDQFGNSLRNIENLSIQVCTDFTERTVIAPQDIITNGYRGDSNPDNNTSGQKLEDLCDPTAPSSETLLRYATAESGTVKGLLTHITDADIYNTRTQYLMTVRTQYNVVESITNDILFTYNTKNIKVKFKHPFDLRLVNLLEKTINLQREEEQEVIRGSRACPTSVLETEDGGSGESEFITYNGGYIGATQPYVMRIELQYRGEALPEGLIVQTSVWKHDEVNPLTEKPERVQLEDKNYTIVQTEEDNIGPDGSLTGGTTTKSFVDISVPHPSLPEYIDIYVRVEYLGFTIDGIHSVRFIGSLKVEAEFNKPLSDGISTAEQFANVFTVDPDYPDDKSRRLPVSDGTLVKWALFPGPDGGGNKPRSFYSSEFFSNTPGQGIYSQTESGVAKNVFFGPVGNIERHEISEATRQCCVGEEWLVRASVVHGEQTASDAEYLIYTCPAEEAVNQRFLMNADDNYEHYRESVHHIIYADGENMLRIQVARDANNSDITGAECFRSCLGGEFVVLEDEQIVQIKAPGEIIWNAVFDFDPYTGEQVLVSYDSVKPADDQDPLSTIIANVPLEDAETTDVYIRANKFITNNPEPKSCEQEGSLSIGSNAAQNLLTELLLGYNPKCQFKNTCNERGDCSDKETLSYKWNNTHPINGQTTMIVDNKEVNLIGGGEYQNGVPPIYVGYKEPLSVRVIDARVNGERLDTRDLVVDGVTKHTFVAEVLFANQIVPDGTPIELDVTGENQDIIVISEGSIVYTRQVNDIMLNPDDPAALDSVPKRSLAYFTIDPLPNISFDVTINLTCRYDKLGVVTRTITDCINLSNTVNITLPEEAPPEEDTEERSTSGATSAETLIYNITYNNYRFTDSMRANRIGHFSCTYISPHHGSEQPEDDYIYAFGGFSGTVLLSSSERYSANTEEWQYVADMPTPRAHGQCAAYENNIYCIGGLEYNPILENFQVSRKIESYNTATGIWNRTLTSMPEGYGISFGHAESINGYVVVICGVNTVQNSSIPEDVNEKVLVYDIENDEWSTLNVSDVDLYKRITPFSFNNINNNNYYVYSGSLPKSEEQIEAEYTEKTNGLLAGFRSSLLTNSYYLALTKEEQEDYKESQENKIKASVNIPAFNYLATGFKFPIRNAVPGTIEVDISDTLDDEWSILPKVRDRGQAIYSPVDGKAFFLGGGNQNLSTTLDLNESIDIANSNIFEEKTPMPRGLASFNADRIADDIYITGGITSGHSQNYININISSDTEQIESLGKQTAGVLVTLTNDSGDLVEGDVNIVIRGRLKIREIEDVLTDYIAARMADRALGGDGTGSVLNSDDIDPEAISRAQSSIIDPNSDEFQFNASRKIGEQLELFPVLFTQREITVNNGVGGTVVMPRSEDPLSEIEKLKDFIKNKLETIDGDTLYGEYTKDELAALGDLLSIVELRPTKIESGITRELYDLEVTATIVDPIRFGQTVSETDKEIQLLLNQKIQALIVAAQSSDTGLNGGESDDDGGDYSGNGIDGTEESCSLILAHSNQPTIPTGNTTGESPNNRDVGGTGRNAQSGQSTFSQSLLPLAPKIREQDDSLLLKFYNNSDWVPQVNRRAVNASLSTASAALDYIKNTTTVGGSPIYSAITDASALAGGETFDSLKKVIYIASDNENNLSTISRDDAIENINSIDGEGEVPAVYTALSTSHPNSIAELAQRTEHVDSEKISLFTGGQSTTLESSSIVDEILDLIIGNATGGMGYGRYTKNIEFTSVRNVSWFSTSFSLPTNTDGEFRYRYSNDGYNFSSWSDTYASSTSQNVNFEAHIIQVEIILTTGFTTGTERVQDTSSTGTPSFVELRWRLTSTREDYLWLNSETVLTNAQQVASVFEGTLPTHATAFLGTATSESVNWNDYQSDARPAVDEFGKMLMLDRTDKTNSIVSLEHMTTEDGYLYKSIYGAWNPEASTILYKVVNDEKQIVSSGYTTFPREGEIYFDTKQPLDTVFQLSIINTDTLRVGVKLTNSSPDDGIIINGVGYIYSTNDIKPQRVAQTPPVARNPLIEPDRPNRESIFVINYQYFDINGDPETGTQISWFINDRQTFEVENMKRWSDIPDENAVYWYTTPAESTARGLTGDVVGSNNLGIDESLLRVRASTSSKENLLKPGDRVKCRVIPSDGRAAGDSSWAPTTAIDERPPTADNLKITAYKSDGQLDNRYSSGSTLRADYKFTGDGENIVEQGTEIKWFVNGSLYKVVYFSQGNEINVKNLEPNEPSLISPNLSHTIGNTIIVEITPSTQNIVGDKQVSESITIVNSVPVITEVVVSPAQANSNGNLTMTYIISDQDISTGDQTDQSTWIWENSTDGGLTYAQVSTLDNALTVPSSELTPGNRWRAVVAPNDGFDAGTSVTSNMSIIT